MIYQSSKFEQKKKKIVLDWLWIRINKFALPKPLVIFKYSPKISVELLKKVRRRWEKDIHEKILYKQTYQMLYVASKYSGI